MESAPFDEHLWPLLEKHGSVAHCYKTECEQLWSTYTIEEQRQIYCALRDKLQNGGFVNYNPVLAVRDNVPKKRLPRKLSFKKYFATFGTTEEQPGWRMIKPETGNVYYEHL